MKDRRDIFEDYEGCESGIDTTPRSSSASEQTSHGPEKTAGEWEYIGPNYKLDADGFYISYLPAGASSLLGGFFAADDDGDETAIVHNGQCYILNGDFREEYAAIVGGGLKACKAFFDDRNNRSSWSNE